MDDKRPFKNYYLYGFLRSDFDLKMEFLIPIFYQKDNKYYIQNIDPLDFLNTKCDFSEITITNIDKLINYSETPQINYFDYTPIYAFTFNGEEVIYGNYEYTSRVLTMNLHKIQCSKHLFYDVLLFLRKFDDARNLVKSKDYFGDYLSNEQINLCQNIKLDEIDTFENKYKTANSCDRITPNYLGNSLDKLILLWLYFTEPQIDNIIKLLDLSSIGITNKNSDQLLPAILNSGHVLKKGSRHKEIITELESHITNNNLAVLLSNDYFRDYEKAVEFYHREITNKPENYIAYNNLAALLSNDYFRDYQRAIDLYHHAIQLKPNDALICNNLAILLSHDRIRDYEGAKHMFISAIDKYADNSIADSNFTFSLQKNCNREYSWTYNYSLNLILSCASDHQDDYNYKAYYSANKYENGNRINNFLILKNYQIIAEFHYNLANLLSNDYFQEFQEAKEHYIKAIILNPSFSEVYYRLGSLLASKYFKDYSEAKSYLLKAIALNPSCLEAYRIMFEICNYLNDEEGYHFFQQQVLRLSANDLSFSKQINEYINKKEKV